MQGALASVDEGRGRWQEAQRRGLGQSCHGSGSARGGPVSPSPLRGSLPHAAQALAAGRGPSRGPICRWNLSAAPTSGLGLSCGLLCSAQQGGILSFTSTARVWFPALEIIAGSY